MTQEQPLSRAEVAELLHCPDEHISYLLIIGQLFSLHRYNVEAYRIAQEFANERLIDYSPIGTQFQKAYKELVGRLREISPGPTEFISTPRDRNPFYRFAREFTKGEVPDWETVVGPLLNMADREIIDQNTVLGKWLQKIPNGVFSRKDIEDALESDDGTISFKCMLVSDKPVEREPPATITSWDVAIEPDKPIQSGGVIQSSVMPWVSSDGGPELISVPEGSPVYPMSLNELANIFRLTKEQIGEVPKQTTWNKDDLLVIDLPREQSDEERIANTFSISEQVLGAAPGEPMTILNVMQCIFNAYHAAREDSNEEPS